MATHGQQLQLLNQMAAIAPALGQGQVLAQASVVGGKGLALLAIGLAALKCFELRIEGVPLGLVLVFKQALFHVGPNKPRAIPWICCSACSAGTCKGSARMLASS